MADLAFLLSAVQFCGLSPDPQRIPPLRRLVTSHRLSSNGEMKKRKEEKLDGGSEKEDI
jgi:hypothetical protein